LDRIEGSAESSNSCWSAIANRETKIELLKG
jgi:hypothetical protein